MADIYHTVLIPLSQGKFAIVDFDDYDLVANHKWYFHKVGNAAYARRSKSKTINGKVRQTHFYMHRVLAAVGSRQLVDHWNRNGLDNRRRNLRMATKSQNNINKVCRLGRSGIRGVFWNRRSWTASISVAGRTKYLGSFRTPAEASIAYNEAASEYYGEFAILNHVNAGGASSGS